MAAIRDIIKQFEPLEDQGPHSNIGPDFYALASIAISLKRIADQGMTSAERLENFLHPANT